MDYDYDVDYDWKTPFDVWALKGRKRPLPCERAKAVDIKEKRMMYFDPMFTSDQDRLESNDIKSSLMSSLMHRHMWATPLAASPGLSPWEVHPEGGNCREFYRLQAKFA